MSHLISNVSLSFKQSDKIGQFLKFFATKFLAKEAQMMANFLGNFEKPHSYEKNCIGYFLGNFWNKLGYFLLQHLVTLVLKFCWQIYFVE